MRIAVVLFVLLLYILQNNCFCATMEAPGLSSAIAKFSAKFCNELEKDKSVVSSPLSAEILLSLLTLGTEDPSHSELLIALEVPSDDAIRSSFSSLSEKLKSIKGVTLNVANKIFLKEGPYEICTELEQDAVKVFDAGIEKVNFDDGVTACNLINKWVEDKTNHRIKDLLSSDSVDSDTRLVLVNALYFKGTWQKQFDPHVTRPQPFFITAEETVEVPMMYREDTYRYGVSDALNAQLLEMAYEGEEASMVIVLPSEIDGLNGVLGKLAAGHDLMGDLSNMFSTKVHVSVPKFKIETEIDLTNVLPKLGINAIFSLNNSGLTKILNNPERLYVSKAVQKAFIEVNEEGAEAAAATGMVVMMRCAMPTLRFYANRPFLYLLLDSSRTTLFVGAYRAK
ncbi:hypothetical protein K1T71_003230 [Dendrolimus kikuchii]|uniref:Uncharacterized protein n=1 Tax=Dendrolimus kikuchii TaxID=765133 RepID=A0ACC1DBE5_9NEOP|nr:hypothetical protein K1T71_003230 [Dendrolimus kikuchii]